MVTHEREAIGTSEETRMMQYAGTILIFVIVEFDRDYPLRSTNTQTEYRSCLPSLNMAPALD